MSRRLTRRAALGAALGAPAALAAVPAAAARPQAPPASTGFFQVSPRGILIGLLLPAVQKVREAAKLLLLDRSGNPIFEVPVRGGAPAFFDVFFTVPPTDGKPGTLALKERGSKLVLEGRSDGILIGLLLPAVAEDGSSEGLLAGSVQVMDDNGGVREILPYVEADNYAGHPGGGGNPFIGPFSCARGEPILIGMLLPAVQKTQRNDRPAEFVLLLSSGKVLVEEYLHPPQTRAPFFSSLFGINWGDGSVRVTRATANGDVLAGEGSSPDGILIGLLLPAVQSGKSVGLLGGSLQMSGETVAFTATSGGVDSY